MQRQYIPWWKRATIPALNFDHLPDLHVEIEKVFRLFRQREPDKEGQAAGPIASDRQLSDDLRAGPLPPANPSPDDHPLEDPSLADFPMVNLSFIDPSLLKLSLVGPSILNPSLIDPSLFGLPLVDVSPVDLWPANPSTVHSRKRFEWERYGGANMMREQDIIIPKNQSWRLK